MGALDILLTLCIPGLILIHLLIAPYTKVEESFNIQATHDILAYGLPRSNVRQVLSSHYDHFDFPGAVPRTFVGSVMLAGVAQPVVGLIGFQHAQLVVRAVLGLFNAACLIAFQRNVGRAYGRMTARWFSVLLLGQFHVLFYASRTLPNMFAFGLTTIAMTQFLGSPKRGRCRMGIGLLTCATTVFRSEIAILLSTSTLYLLLTKRVFVLDVLRASLVAFIFSLSITIPLDSYFWQKPLWPELWGFYFNVVKGSSSEWGISPWYYYFANALPKLLVNPLALPTALYALALPGTRGDAAGLTLPCLAFVAIYSVQPHKEARFIFYVVPPFTAAVAMGANYVFTRRAKNAMYSLASLALVASVLLSFATSTGMLLISSLNYPGGEALAQLRALEIVAGDNLKAPAISPSSPGASEIKVHADVLACMTGVTLFGQHTASAPNGDDGSSRSINFKFDKTEKPFKLRSPAFWSQFQYVLTEDPEKVIGSWETVGVVEGFVGLEISRPGFILEESKAEQGGGRDDDKVVGRGALVRAAREKVKRASGGWWIGPKMEPRIRILKKRRAETVRRPAVKE